MKSQPQSATLIQFGPFSFDKALGKLSKHGTHIRLGGMPLKILEHLVERPGEAVSRAELQNLLWNGTAFGDFEQGLNTAVNVVRRTLSDSADQPRYIETVPGKGYRFIAPLRSEAAVQEEHTSTRRSTRARWRMRTNGSKARLRLCEAPAERNAVAPRVPNGRSPPPSPWLRSAAERGGGHSNPSHKH